MTSRYLDKNCNFQETVINQKFVVVRSGRCGHRNVVKCHLCARFVELFSCLIDKISQIEEEIER